MDFEYEYNITHGFLDFDATDGTGGTGGFGATHPTTTKSRNATCSPSLFYLESLGCGGSKVFFVLLYTLCLILFGVALLYIRFLYLHFYPHVQGMV